MSAQQTRLRIDGILQFMSSYWPWVNCHMVNYLTDKHWLNYVPLELQKEIETNDCIDECIERVFWSESLADDTKFPNCLKFKKQAHEHSLHNFKDILMKQDDFERKILGLEENSKQQIKIKEFLTEKKRHEVEVTAGLVNNLIESSLWHNHTLVVDAGDGKGYLSSRLSLEYGHRVLGIDSNPTNTENALERSKKLKKAWNGLKERADLESKGVTPPRRGNWKEKRKQKEPENDSPQTVENANYKTTDKFITSDMDLMGLIHEQFQETKSSMQPPCLCITGLHTCGNLAPTCLKLFHSQTQCKLICNIGCCYHLLNEKFSGPEFFGNKHIEDLNQEIGFPLSKYLQEKQIKIGRNARMLAAQSIERTLAAKELPNISLFYRAMLELLICEQNPELKDTVQVGKIRKFNSFEEYVALCSKKYPNLNIPKQKIKLIEQEEEGCGNRKYLDLFYLLRMTFAPVLESLILLDRLLYLQEMGHTQSYLIPVFDPVVSPRHFAIIAIKNET